MLRIRDIVNLNKSPRPILVQPHIYLENDQIKIREFPETYEGVIESF
jgi:hypothetical protein